MPRAVAFSAKKKRKQLQDRRAVKRGDIDPHDTRIPNSRRTPTAHISARLQSQFIALTPEYIAATRDKAYTHRLARPIPDDVSVFSGDIMRRDGGALVCPTRPTFRYDMTKKEVERNEQGMFAKWLKDTEAVVKAYVAGEGEGVGEGVAGVEGIRGTGEGGVGAGGVEGSRATEGGVEAHNVEGIRATGESDVGNVDPGSHGEEHSTPIRSPTWFETNLEVYRQLWRVTESSDILLLLADARCPPVHLPHSLRHYVQTHALGRTQHRKEVVVVLTKTDMCDPVAVDGWVEWVKAWWREGLDALRLAQRQRSQRGSGVGARADEARGEGEQSMAQVTDVDVVCVHSYDTDLLYNSSRHRPDLPSAALHQLTEALRRAHERLSAPPPHMDEHKRARWVPAVRAEVDWDLLAQGPAAAWPPAGEHEMDEGMAQESDAEREGSSEASGAEGDRDERPAQGHGTDDGGDQRHVAPSGKPLTIGLIGQPNVGKSSLLNALMGESRVRASKTPGKTLFWGWKRHVKIVDCPGLVCPSLVGLEMQALCGVLPISQIPSLPACLTTAASLIPLETVFRITQPATSPVDPYADKRTWRHPRPEAESVGGVGIGQGDGVALDDGGRAAAAYRWTAWELIEARARDRGYASSSLPVTAKSARPDVNRAANAMLRSLAEGKVRWGFYPPSPPSSTSTSDEGAANTIAASTSSTSDAQAAGPARHPTFDRAGKGIWLGEYVNDPEDGIEDDDADASEDDDARGEAVVGAHREPEARVESDSSDDGEVSEVEDRARRLDQGFFAALGLDGDGGDGSDGGEADDDDDDDETPGAAVLDDGETRDEVLKSK